MTHSFPTLRSSDLHDHAHGVIEVTAAHLVLEIDGDDFPGELGHCDSFRCGSGACPVPRKTVSRALRHKREILARNTLPMPDYFHVETRTCGVFLSAGRALAKRRGNTRPVLRSEEHTSELQSLMRNSY